MSEADIGFFDEAMEMLHEKRKQMPVEVEQFLHESPLDTLAEVEEIDGRVVVWPSRALLEFLGLEDRR